MVSRGLCIPKIAEAAVSNELNEKAATAILPFYLRIHWENHVLQSVKQDYASYAKKMNAIKAGLAAFSAAYGKLGQNPRKQSAASRPKIAAAQRAVAKAQGNVVTTPKYRTMLAIARKEIAAGVWWLPSPRTVHEGSTVNWR